MKTNYFLKLEIELTELQVKLANHRLDKHYAMEKEQFEQANLAIQAQTTTLPDPEQNGLTDTIPKLHLPKPNISYKEKDPAEDLNRHINPANLAVQEHFSHIFTQLTALHEKMMEEERFIEAKNVMDQCMSVAVYIQTWGEERW